MIRNSLNPKPVSPAATGNAGAHFEARLGAYYFLTMIAGGEPRGLPGTSIRSVALQQRMSGNPLDDVVVHAIDANGLPARLEIQAKRSMAFTASDAEFADVVSQMWAASEKSEFDSSRYELAAAISRTTTRIEEAVQDVLHWARVHGSASSFHADLRRTGFASESMRDFVKVFRENLKKCGAPDDDYTIWRLLRRFQVLVFDFEAEGSSYEHYARDRCRLLLTVDQAGRAGDLWAHLIVEAGSVARSAGARSRQEIVENLATEEGYCFAPERAHQTSFDRLAEEAELALKDVDDHIGGARLSRAELVEQGRQKLGSSRFLNITGAPGSGKTMVLKRFVALIQTEGRVMVLRGGRIVGGGWMHLAHALGTSSSVRDFFTDLASAGGATLFVDNIDQVDDPRERQTIADLIEVGSTYPGWSIVVTTNSDRTEWTTLLPQPLRGTIATLQVPPISDAEASVLSEQNSTIANLLRPDHPAKGIVRNLFYLARLVGTGSIDANNVSTEVDLARLWWRYAGGRSADGGRFARLKAMRKMGAEALAHPGRPATKADDLDSKVIEELLRLDVIREEVPGAEVAFRHDVLRDWTIGIMIAENPEILNGLPKQGPAATAIVRGLEIAARIALDEDLTGQRWRSLLDDTSEQGVHGSWRRPILLALPRSERAPEHFDALKANLFANAGALLCELVRLLVAVDSTPIADVLAKSQPGLKIPAGATDFVFPKGESWPPTIMWLVSNIRELPPAATLDVTKAFIPWLMLTSGFGINLPVNAEIVGTLFEWLDLLDEESRPRIFRQGELLPKLSNIPHHKDTRECVRLAAFSFAQVNVEAARSYLAKLNRIDVRDQELEQIINGRGALAKAAPHEFADYFMAGITDPEDNDDPYSRRRDYGPFGYHEHILRSAGPTQGPMLEMLQTAPAEGLALVRRIVEQATDWQRKRYRRSNASFPRFSIPLVWGEQFFEGDEQVYRFARSSVPSTITTSALMALEAWSHQRLEAGDDPESVLRDILGVNESSVAFLSVAVDIVLSHWPKFVEIAWPFVASPHAMKLDEDRHTRDIVGVDNFSLFPDNDTDAGPSRANLHARPSRRARLLQVLSHYILHRRDDIGPKIRSALEEASQTISRPQLDEGEDPLTGLYALAQRTARMADPDNWEDFVGRREDGTEVPLLRYIPGEVEQRLMEARSKEVNASSHRAETMASIQLAFSDTSRVTPQVVSEAIAWAQTEPSACGKGIDDEEFEIAQAKRAVVMAAVLAVRHCKGATRPKVVSWARTVFRATMVEADDERYGAPQIEYNAKAIAAAGLISLYEQSADPTLRREILELAARPQAAVANAIATGFPHLRASDQRFLRSVLRMFVLTVNYVRDRYDDNYGKRQADRAAAVSQAIEAEIVWLETARQEPDWPAIAPWQIRSKRRTRIPGPGAVHERSRRPKQPADLYADETRLGMVSSHLVTLAVGERPDWLLGLTQHLLNWAIEANGPDEDDHDADGRPFTFNASFFDYIGILIAALPHDEAVSLIVEPVMGLPDEAFFDAVAMLIRGFDRAVLSSDATKPDDLFALRVILGARLQKTDGYKRLEWRKSFSCEMHLGDALCAIFYQGQRGFSLGLPLPPRPPSNLAPVMPTLTALITSAPSSGYAAVLFLDLLEVMPSAELAPFALEVVLAWVRTHDIDTSFWGNNDIGARVCAWFTKVFAAHGIGLTNSHQTELRTALDVMVRAGVTSARALEDFIDATNTSPGRSRRGSA